MFNDPVSPTNPRLIVTRAFSLGLSLARITILGSEFWSLSSPDFLSISLGRFRAKLISGFPVNRLSTELTNC